MIHSNKLYNFFVLASKKKLLAIIQTQWLQICFLNHGYEDNFLFFYFPAILISKGFSIIIISHGVML